MLQNPIALHQLASGPGKMPSYAFNIYLKSTLLLAKMSNVLISALKFFYFVLRKNVKNSFENFIFVARTFY